MAGLQPLPQSSPASLLSFTFLLHFGGKETEAQREMLEPIVSDHLVESTGILLLPLSWLQAQRSPANQSDFGPGKGREIEREFSPQPRVLSVAYLKYDV